VLEGPQGVEPLVGGRRLLSFCSNDYLGLASHPDVVAALADGAHRYGAGSGASHLVSGHSRAHHVLEEELAEFVGRPRALLFSTGYMANLALASTLVGRRDAVFEDRLNHASLIDAAVLSRARLHRYPHADADALARLLATNDAPRKLVLTDGVFSMDGDAAPAPSLAHVARAAGAWLAVDDAHGLGVVGPTGRGTLEATGLGAGQVPILVGTLGKALGTFGAFVAGSEALIEALVQLARPYIYTTALPPAVAEATRASLRCVRSGEARGRLWARIHQFRAGARDLGLPIRASDSAVHALVVGSADAALRVSEGLRERGVLVPAIRPPTVPEGTARLRITLCADHRADHVDRLLEVLAMVAP
jgi:8-amino-7-oxononanoate synthase